MRKDDQEGKYFYLSVGLHAALLAVLIVGVDIYTPMPVLQQSHENNVISAVVLGDSFASKLLPQASPPEEKVKPVVASASNEVASQKKEAIESQKDAIALKAIQKKKELAKKKALAEKKRQQKIKARKKRLAAIRAKKEREKKRLEQEMLAEMKKAKQKKKKLAKKKLQNQFKQNLKMQAEASMRQQLLDEEIRMQALKAQKAKGVVNKYKALILQAISENWIVPRHANRKRYSELRIRLAPNGMVLDVQITKSSGDLSVDQSARAAVLKSSPLPVPKKANSFEAFRHFVLKVRPEEVLKR